MKLPTDNKANFFSSVILAAFALIQGFRLCFFNPVVRKFSFIPWLIGLFIYSIGAGAAWYWHSDIVSYYAPSPDSLWSHITYSATWLGVALLLLIVVSVLSIIIVLIATATVQSEIVIATLKQTQSSFSSSETGAIKEVTRTILAESFKLIWLIPISIVIAIAGLIPVLTPFAIIVGAWLLAYQFVDIVLDTLKYGGMKRLGFSLRHAIPITIFGLTLLALWAVPLLGWLLPPVAVAGCTWFLSKTNLIG